MSQFYCHFPSAGRQRSHYGNIAFSGGAETLSLRSSAAIPALQTLNILSQSVGYSHFLARKH